MSLEICRRIAEERKWYTKKKSQCTQKTKRTSDRKMTFEKSNHTKHISVKLCIVFHMVYILFVTLFVFAMNWFCCHSDWYILNLIFIRRKCVSVAFIPANIDAAVYFDREPPLESKVEKREMRVDQRQYSTQLLTPCG